MTGNYSSPAELGEGLIPVAVGVEEEQKNIYFLEV